jgi:hypothetical protein
MPPVTANGLPADRVAALGEGGRDLAARVAVAVEGCDEGVGVIAGQVAEGAANGALGATGRVRLCGEECRER